MAAIVVIEQHVLGRLDGAGNDVPARGDEVVARIERRVLRQAAGGDDDDVGRQRQHVVLLGPDIVADVDAEPLEFGQPPVDDADQLLAARVLRGEPDLAAGLSSRFQHRHRMAALGGDARRLQPGGAGADHHDLPCRPVRLRIDMRDRRLAAGRGIVDAQRLAALIDAVEAVGRADARADLVLAALHHLLHDMRIGDVGARHADHVELAGGDGMPGGRDIRDARGMEDRELRRRPHLAGEIEMRRRAHAGDRDDLGQRRVGLDRAADDVEEIELAGRRQPLRDLDALVPSTGPCRNPRRRPCGCRR